jgi:hypothetical protein
MFRFTTGSFFVHAAVNRVAPRRAPRAIKRSEYKRIVNPGDV